MRPRSSRRRIWGRLLAGSVILAATAVIGSYGDRWLRETGAAAPVATSPRLRLSGKQFLLNWQSFAGREVLVEYCTIVASDASHVTCRVFDGQMEMGYVLLDVGTLDPASTAWARQTCATSRPTRNCTSKVSGTIRKGDDGRPVLDHAAIET